MKNVLGEDLTAIVRANRKGNGGSRETQFELGIGYVTDFAGKPTGEIRIRTEQIETGVAPIVGTLKLDKAEEILRGLIEAIQIAKGCSRGGSN